MPGIGLHKTINSKVRKKLNYSIKNQRIIGFSHTIQQNICKPQSSSSSLSEEINNISERVPQNQFESSTNDDLYFEPQRTQPISSANNNTDFLTPVKELTAKERLAQWAVTYNIKRNALDSLLQLLTTNSNFEDLPRDSRTLLKTPRQIPIESLDPGYYCHFPVKDSLVHIFLE